MEKLILKVLLALSLFFNVSLYFWWMDLGQYRNYVDKWIETWKEILTSQEFANLKTSAISKITNAYSWDIDKLKTKIISDIWKYWEDKTKDMLQEQYWKLDEKEIDVLIEDAKSQMNKWLNATNTWSKK